MPARLLLWLPSFSPAPHAPARMASIVWRPRRDRREPHARTQSPAWLLGVMLVSTAARALAPNALPEGPALRQGGAAIARDARGLQIVQMGDHAIIDWRSFDIGPRVAVQVLQTSAEATLLNRVTGSTASEIAGSLTASGRVFLINPNGIGFAPTGTIDAAAFVASTLDIADRDFMAGVLRFGAPPRADAGAIVQAGEITIDSGGFAALLGRRIAHCGVIRAPLGQAGLAVGERVTLTPGGDGFLQVTRPAAAPEGGLAAVDVSGVVEARGGLALLSAPAPAHATVDVGGTRLAGRLASRPGMIVINGGGGTVRLSGVLDASSGIAGDGHEPGGTVDIAGSRLVMDGPVIDARGARDGGYVRLAVNAMEGANTVDCLPPARVTLMGNAPARIARPPPDEDAATLPAPLASLPLPSSLPSSLPLPMSAPVPPSSPSLPAT